VVMAAAIVVLRERPADVDFSAFPVPRRVVYAMAVVALPLNLLLVVLVATQEPVLFVGWAGGLLLGLAVYLLRTSYDSPGETTPTDR